MRKYLLFILIVSCGVARAQYNNEWIDYNKTYYKFSVAKNSVNRISQASLQSIGLQNTPSEQFQLWRNGAQIPLYTSVASGTLGSNDYLEFWGEMNDGKPDINLYSNINYQLSDKWSLETDTASYFLTVNPAGNNLRLVNQTNNVAGNVLPAEPYFMYTAGRYFKNKINAGYAQIVTEYIYSSVYDRGEGYTSDDIYPGAALNDNLPDLYPYTAGPNGTFYIAACGNAVNTRTFNAKVNGTKLVDVAMDAFTDQRQLVSLPVSLLSSGLANVVVTNVSTNPNDRMVVAKYELTYPRQFNFGNESNFVFELPATNSGNYLRITFTYGSNAPVLYDLTNLKRFTAVIDEAGIAKFALPASLQKRKLVLMSMESSNINAPANFTTRNFVDYSQQANQGDYVIISNPLLYAGANGNPVDAYRQYRSSAAGGSYNAKVYDIDQLTDQFGFGIKRHPFAIKKFLKYARTIFNPQPKFIFLIGKGVSYVAARSNESDAILGKTNLIPPFGYPASDNLLASNDNETISATPTGRLSVVSPAEVEIYLNKVKEYESVGVSAPQTIDGRAWMKNIVHAIGGGNSQLSMEIGGYMNQLRTIAQDTLWGADVESFSKTTAVASQLTTEQLKKLFSDGIGIVNYFGHSSATVTEFNIDDPSIYDNQGKYPLFLVNGCLAGDIFNFEPNRLSTITTLSEKYVVINQRGAIGFIASTHYGIVNYLNLYLHGMYNAFSQQEYGRPIGETLEAAFRYLLSTVPGDYLARLHAEEVTLQGDPAIKLYTQNLPDYVVEDQYVNIPPVISVTDNNFKLSVKFFNIGKAIPDSLEISIKRQLPNGTLVTVLTKRIPGIRNTDSVNLLIPINPAIEKGENKLIITLDANNERDEISEMNNTITKSFYIIEDAASPVYPDNFAIIKEPTQKLYASTADPLSATKNYIMEIDTTENFNSVGKVSRTISSSGGLLEFNPQFTYRDSTVYYWRVSLVPSSGEEYQWADHSFMYKINTEGYNQSHYFQHTKSSFDRIYLDSASRKFKYLLRDNDVFIRNCIYQPGCEANTDFLVSLNNNDVIQSACVGNSLIFNVIDSITFKPWSNVDGNGNNLYLYGSASANCGVGRQNNFEYSYMNASSRKLMMDFMDLVPDGDFVVVRSFDYNNPNSFSATWKGDTSLYGSNNSLYHKLKEAGFEAIDSINQFKAWVFIYQKGRKNQFAPAFKVASGFGEKITLEVTCKTPDTLGFITSPKFGPARSGRK
ncbi:MAG: C25 family cysteine peptidase [Agriterribacter sp.]